MLQLMINWILWQFTFYADGGDGGAAADDGGAGGPADGGQGAVDAGGGAANDNWFNGLPEDMQGYVQNKGWKGPQDVLQSYQNLEKLHGVPAEQILKIPGKDAEEGAWSEIFGKLGRPENATDYEVPVPEGESGDFAEQMKPLFHKADLTREQARVLAEGWNEFAGQQAQQTSEQQQQQAQEQEAALKREWGKAFDQNIKTAKAAAHEFRVDGDQIDQLEKVMGYDGVMKFMANIGSRLGEDGYVNANGGNNNFNGAMTPQQAKDRIGALRNNPGFVKRYSSGDADARAEMDRLHEMAYPGE